MNISQAKKMNNFCLMPWFGLTISPFGYIRPCCEYEKAYSIQKDPPLYDLYNGPEFIALRKSFLKGEKPTECQRCWRREKELGFSPRQGVNKKFFKFVPSNYIFKDRLNGPQWLLMDFFVSNTCNLKCRMCGIWGSVRWLDDEKKLKQLSSCYNRKNKEDPWSLQSHFGSYKTLLPGIKKTKQFLFQGGEPFLDPDHAEFLEYLISHNLHHNLSLTYITNGTIVNDKILSLLSCFKKIVFIVSVEGLEELYKYIRGGDYSFETDVIENIKRFEQLPNVIIRFNAVIQAYNVLSLSDLYKYLHELNMKKVIADNSFGSIVHHPTYLNPFVLPYKLRRLAAERLAGIKEFGVLRENLLQGREDQVNFKIFKNFTNDLDSIRGESVLDVIPEFKEFWY